MSFTRQQRQSELLRLTRTNLKTGLSEKKLAFMGVLIVTVPLRGLQIGRITTASSHAESADEEVTVLLVLLFFRRHSL